MKPIFTPRYPTFDLTDYKVRLRQAMIAALKKAITEWLKTAVSVIPVWQGYARGTFVPLASKVGYTVEISPKVGRQGLSMALQLASVEKTRQTRASVGKIEVNSNQFTFTYSTHLWHLIFNEYLNANENKDAGRVKWELRQPGPYHFQEKALQAFTSACRGIKLPAVKPYIRAT